MQTVNWKNFANSFNFRKRLQNLYKLSRCSLDSQGKKDKFQGKLRYIAQDVNRVYCLRKMTFLLKPSQHQIAHFAKNPQYQLLNPKRVTNRYRRRYGSLEINASIWRNPQYFWRFYQLDVAKSIQMVWWRFWPSIQSDDRLFLRRRGRGLWGRISLYVLLGASKFVAPDAWSLCQVLGLY